VAFCCGGPAIKPFVLIVCLECPDYISSDCMLWATCTFFAKHCSDRFMCRQRPHTWSATTATTPVTSTQCPNSCPRTCVDFSCTQVCVAPTWPYPCKGLRPEHLSRDRFGKGVPLEVAKTPEDGPPKKQLLPLLCWRAAGPQQQDDLQGEVSARQGSGGGGGAGARGSG
jgi:hypothetical protein